MKAIRSALSTWHLALSQIGWVLSRAEGSGF